MTQQNKNRDRVLDLIIDGRLVEQYGDFDTAGLLQQLTQGSAA